MSFNKNNPNAMGKLMGYLKQLSTEMGGSEQNRRGVGDEERLYRQRGTKYARVPSRPTLSASTTCTSLATSCGSQGTLVPNYACIPEHVSTESSSEDEQETFEKTRRHFQQLRQISLGNEFKYKMEMEIKSAKNENLRNAVPYVTQLSTDNVKAKVDGSINGDGKPYKPTTQRIYILTQLFSALAVAMGSLVIGFSSSYTSSALTNMNETLSYSDEQKSWIGGILPLAALIGGVVGGPLIEYLGRKRTIIATAVPFFVGWMLIATANHVFAVLAGRAFCGFCVGVLSLASPVYLGETVQPEVRGILGLLPTAFGNIGILLGFLAGTYLNWSQLAYLGAVLPAPFLILMFFTPETPRWYITKRRNEDALKSLQWLRGKNINVEKEMRDLTFTQTESDKTGSGIGQIFSRKYLPAVLISLGLMLFQQFSGINAVVFYATEIFQKSGSTIDENLSSIIIGIVNFISTFLATAIIDKLGRKILLYISAVLMIITLVILGTYLYVQSAQEAAVSTYGWIPLACLVIYVLGFSIGFGPIPWLMVGEILPSKIRSSAASIVTGFNWSCTFLVTKTFQNIVSGIDLYGTIWLFAMFCLAALFFVIFFVPETKGRSLEDIEKRLTGGMRRVRSSTKQPQDGC